MVRMGSVAPMAKQTVSATEKAVTCLVAPTTTIAVKTGPAHGTKTAPSPRPSTKPDPEPFGVCVLSRANGRSNNCSRGGTSRERPKMMRTTMPASRRNVWGSPSALSNVDPTRVMMLKLVTSPATTAMARRRRARAACTSPVMGDAHETKITGNTGNMQGEMPAMRPATTPTNNSAIILDSTLRQT